MNQAMYGEMKIKALTKAIGYTAIFLIIVAGSSLLFFNILGGTFYRC
jgi:hypothetical protein